MAGHIAHGHARHRTGSVSPEYNAWCGMKTRCTNPNRPYFADYGGRGITVCERWRDDFAAFLADMGPKPSPRHSIDRIDNTKGYGPDNCRWATPADQARNTRRNINITRDGVTLCLRAWCERLGLNYARVQSRVYGGREPSAALY